MRRAEIAQPNRPLGLEPLLQCRGNPRLADAGLSGNQHDLTFAVLGLGPSSQQQLDFLVAADERAQCCRTQGLEAAFEVLSLSTCQAGTGSASPLIATAPRSR